MQKQNKEPKQNQPDKAYDKKYIYDQVNVRIPTSLNDWLNDIVRKTKRLHGSKIPKEIIIEAALDMLRELDLDWNEIESKNDLKQALLQTNQEEDDEEEEDQPPE